MKDVAKLYERARPTARRRRRRRTERDQLGGCPMKRSTERFLTTHTGSLPRPDDLIRMMYAKEEGVPVDRGGAWARACARPWPRWSRSRSRPASISSTTARCPSPATPPTSRIGSPASAAPATPSSTRISPSSRGWSSACSAIPAARAARRRPATGRSACAMPRPHAIDADNLKAAVAGTKAAETFMSAASPGVVSLFFRNDHYKDHETYLHAIAEAMRHEYETVTKAGIVLQIDCPDLGMGRHIQYGDLSLEEFRKRARMHVEALNHAVAQHSPGAAAHAPVLGQLRGPAPLRRAARRRHRHRLPGQAAGHLARSRQSAPRPRMDRVREREAARRQGADPRRHRSRSRTSSSIPS